MARTVFASPFGVAHLPGARRLYAILSVDFHKSDRPVKTASVAQVRKPIYKTSVKRWKKYGEGLQPLVDAIEGKSEQRGSKAKAKVEENAWP
jgi:hypothetical protein